MSLLSSITSFFHGEKRICSSEFEHAVNEVFLSDIPASLLSVLNALADLTGTGLSRKITLGSRNTAKLTAAQLAIATNKGWILG